MSFGVFDLSAPVVGVVRITKGQFRMRLPPGSSERSVKYDQSLHLAPIRILGALYDLRTGCHLCVKKALERWRVEIPHFLGITSKLCQRLLAASFDFRVSVSASM